MAPKRPRSKRKYASGQNTVTVFVSRPQLANSLVPSEIKPGTSVATVSAVLHSKDNKHTLQVRAPNMAS